MKFKPEDFVSKMGLMLNGADAAEKANARLAEMLAEHPLVYGKKYGTGWLMSGEYQQPHDTHIARLVDIKPIGEKG